VHSLLLLLSSAAMCRARDHAAPMPFSRAAMACTDRMHAPCSLDKQSDTVTLRVAQPCLRR